MISNLECGIHGIINVMESNCLHIIGRYVLCVQSMLYTQDSHWIKKTASPSKINLSFVNMKLAELSIKHTLTKDLAEKIPTDQHLQK